ncbi:MFS transporter [Dactylosporangium sp. CA-092794]|uniref:MFS transporter n=1 Tax=Dactylosporangium sp. CA-092794 TaxID=3239929 RepID=UPI003D8F8E94
MAVEAEKPDTATFGSLLGNREFMVAIAGFALHSVSAAAMSVALSVLVYERTGSPLLSGLALVSSALPYLFGATFLLAYADRMPPRRGLAGISVAQAAVLALLATGLLPVAAMLAVSLALGAVLPIGTAIRSALLPDLLGSHEYVLGRAVLNMTGYITQVVGFAAGGTLLATTDAPVTLWFAGALSVAAFLTLRFGLRPRPARGRADGAAWRQTWRVNRRLLADPAVRGLLLAHWLPLAAIAGPEAAFVPYAAQHGRPELGSVLLWSVAAGGLAGDLTVGRFVAPAWQERLALPLALWMGLPLLLFAAGPGLPAAAVVCFLAVLGVAYQLGLQRRFLDAVPEEARGQAFGLLLTGIVTIQALAQTVAAALAEGMPARYVIVSFGGVVLLTALGLARRLRPAN